MTASDLERVPGVVVGPPGFVAIDRTSATKRFLSANRCLLGGHPASRHAINQHFVARLGDTTVIIEVLQAEKPLRVGKYAGIKHRPRDDGRPPRTHVGWCEILWRTFRWHDIHSMSPPAGEIAPEGHHCANPVSATSVDAINEVSEPGRRKWEEADVVLAQIGPTRCPVGEGFNHPRPEASSRTDVLRQTQHPDSCLQFGIVEATDAVDHHDDTFSSQALDFEERSREITSQCWSHVSQNDRGDRSEVGLRSAVACRDCFWRFTHDA
jgi:hypothetical protein